MARFSRLDVLNEINRLGIIPVFYNANFETAKKIVDACADGGARVIEFTNRGDNAYRIFSDLVLHYAKERPEVILGVGSVGDPATGAIFMASGANFVVGSVFNPELAKICNRRKVAYCPGCGSATEISQAEELGVEIVKVFPGDSVGGTKFVKSILGPTPWTRIMPTGGVEANEESITNWFKAGVAAVGMGSDLIKKDWVQTENFAAITELTGKCLQWVQSARGVNIFTGVEHVGLYPTEGSNGMEVAEWYKSIFNFDIKEGNSSIFIQGSGSGRIEISKSEVSPHAHIAISVSNFEAAMEILSSRGIELETPNIRPTAKSVYLKQADPAGHRIHLLWRK
jgi:2-dehydro-3-deoxyphosphogluconate aldolase/(4S)-4-hydroxy-2-oxoglutarate aldolase